MYLQDTNLSNIISESELIEFNAFLVQQLKSD